MTDARVIFLDIDGVLNSHLWFMRRPESHPDLRSDRDLWQIDPEAVRRLEIVCRDAGITDIVVSSTWRRLYSIEEITEILRRSGFKSVDDYRFDETPDFSDQAYVYRGNEIQCSLNKLKAKHGIKFLNQYVILDDDSDMLYWQRDNFILVNADVGLTDRDCYRIKTLMASRVNVPSDSKFQSETLI